MGKDVADHRIRGTCRTPGRRTGNAGRNRKDRRLSIPRSLGPRRSRVRCKRSRRYNYRGHSSYLRYNPTRSRQLSRYQSQLPGHNRSPGRESPRYSPCANRPLPRSAKFPPLTEPTRPAPILARAPRNPLPPTCIPPPPTRIPPATSSGHAFRWRRRAPQPRPRLQLLTRVRGP
jgi:hypothetical protein